jgi:hypothetical protein
LRNADVKIILWRMDPLLGNGCETNYKTNSRFCAMTPRLADIPGPFLGNGSVNTFSRQRIRMEQRNCI